MTEIRSATCIVLPTRKLRTFKVKALPYVVARNVRPIVVTVRRENSRFLSKC